MTAKEVFDLRNKGRTAEAYEAARQLYAEDKGKYATTCMFWTAHDMLRQLTREKQTDEAQLVLKALERVLERMTDSDGKARSALDNARRRLDDAIGQGDPDHKASHARLGKWGEQKAVEYLLEEGYAILERDWHSSHRDLDIVALDDDTVVFVEVKTRSNTEFGVPEQAVDYWKQRHLQWAINHYLQYRHIDRPWRFDVIAIVGTVDSEPTIRHIKDFALSAR